MLDLAALIAQLEALGLIVIDPDDEATIMRVAGALTGEQFTGLTWGEIEIHARAVLAALAVKP